VLLELGLLRCAAVIGVGQDDGKDATHHCRDPIGISPAVERACFDCTSRVIESMMQRCRRAVAGNLSGNEPARCLGAALVVPLSATGHPRRCLLP
jgi:hypothetical protein